MIFFFKRAGFRNSLIKIMSFECSCSTVVVTLTKQRSMPGSGLCRLPGAFRDMSHVSLETHDGPVGAEGQMFSPSLDD